MIETWGFYIFNPGINPDHEPGPVELQASYDRYMELWSRCEDWGFDGLTWAEHHFSSMNLSPSPHLVVAAVAARTTTLRLSTLGSVLALHDARRYVEEVGMLDYLTGGRFEPGIAPGAGDTEAVLAGIPSEQVRPRYYAAAEMIEKVVAGPLVTQHDEFNDLEKVRIVPRMRPETGRSIWTTVMSPGSAAWAAERGHRMCTSWLSTPAAAALASAYRDAAAAAGRPAAPSDLGIRRRVFVADSDAEAQDKVDSAVDLVQATAGKAFETPDPTILAMMSHPDDYAIGSPETVAEKLIEQCRAGGFGVVNAFPDFATFDHADLVRSHELIGGRVAPILRSANVGSGPDQGRAASTSSEAAAV